MVDRTATPLAPKFKAAQIGSIDDATRSVKFVASDESSDRYGDIIRVAGWDLKNFKRNPVLLFAHDSESPPIGSVDAAVEGTKLMATATFLPEGVYDFADTIWRIVKAGVLRAVSVGFMPIVDPNIMYDKEDRFQGFEFIGQELLELSIVPVGANANAIAVSKALKLNPEFVKRLLVEESASAALLRNRRSVDLIRLRDSGR